jgi:hypothetical protein
VQVPTHIMHGSQPDSSEASSPANDDGSQGANSTPNKNAGQSQVASHQPRELVLPSVPIDQLLDDHATEFEECKRWANSDAGQAAHMTNPAGFANVRAHAEAHLRAMQQLALTQQMATAAAAANKPSAK